MNRLGLPALKVLLALVLLYFVGREFARHLDRSEIQKLRLDWTWLVGSALAYLAAWGFSAWFWHRLLWTLGDRPDWLATIKGYYIGHLGKYMPGKALALLLRAGYVRGHQVRFGVAILTSFYEVLTTMASGALIAAILMLIYPPDVAGFDWHPLYTGLLLLGLCGVPLLPGVFNLLVRRLSSRFVVIESYQLPPLRALTLIEGLAITLGNWALLGVSVWMMLQAVVPAPPELTFEVWAQCTIAISLGSVAGFLVLVTPGGIGVREFFLLKMLAFGGPASAIVAVAILTRLAWTGAELIFAGLLVLIPGHKTTGGPPLAA